MKLIKHLLLLLLIAFSGVIPAVKAADAEKGITVKFMLDISGAMKEQKICQATAAVLAGEINKFIRENSSRLAKLNVRILVDSFYQKGTSLESTGIFDYRLGQNSSPKYEALSELDTKWFVEDETSLNSLINRHWPPESKNTILIVLSNSQKTLSEAELKSANTDPRAAGSTLKLLELPRPSNYSDTALKAEIGKRLHEIMTYVNGKIKSFQSEMAITVKLNDKVVQLNESHEALTQAPVNVVMSAKLSNIKSFYWLWDKKKYPGTTLNRTLENGGIYEITAVGIDSIGEEHKYKVVLNVTDSPKPVPNFTFFPLEGQAPLTIATTNKTRNGQKYQWNWGDGTAEDTAMAPQHTFKKPGKFTITLTVLGSDGSVEKMVKNIVVKTPPPQADFECKPAKPNAGDAVTFVNKSLHGATYSWNFGDGGTSSEVTPAYTYKKPGRYNVTLTAVTADGRSVKVQKLVDVDVKLAAGFSYSISMRNPRQVNFSNQSSGAVSCQWNFGDGSTSSENNPVHTYRTGKRYNVTLTVTGKNGKTDSYSEPVRIVSGSADVQKQSAVDFSCSPVESASQLEYKFINKSSGVSNYQWNFGDGKTSKESSPTHVYEITGEREVTVTLTAQDASGNQMKKSVKLKLKPVEQGSSLGVVLLVLVIIGGGLVALYFLLLRKKVAFTVRYFSDSRKELGSATVNLNEEFSLEKVGCQTGLRCKIIKSTDSEDDYQVIFRNLGDSKVVIKQKMSEIKLGGDAWSDPRSLFSITVNGGMLSFTDKNSEEGE